MKRPRIIPVLLLEEEERLVKSIQFKNPIYIGDPMNALKIFNEKEVDEMIVLDINATLLNIEPRYDYIESIASECFMPLTYGGGVNKVNQIGILLRKGVEKVSINSVVHNSQDFIKNAATEYGSSTIVVSVDLKRNWLGNLTVYNRSKMKVKYSDPYDFVRFIEDQGAGELLVNFVDKDGMQSGYELEIIRNICNALTIPVVACGGAGSLQHMLQAIENGASAAAAGSIFVFKGSNRAVLINYPDI